MNTTDIISDDRIEQLSTKQLEDLEFRIYVELRNREDTALEELSRGG